MIKIRLLISALALLLTLASHGQGSVLATNYATAWQLTLSTPMNNPVPAAFTSAEFLRRRPRYPRNPKVKTGAIMAISGGGMAVAGMFVLVFLYPGGEDGPANRGALNTGLGLLAVGGIVAVTGGIIAGVGHRENKRRYGWELVCPGKNEIGLAYNF